MLTVICLSAFLGPGMQELSPTTDRTKTMYLMNFPMEILMSEMKKLALMSPKTMVMALPRKGMKAKKPIHAP